MSIFKLVTNTIEGVTETAVNGAKLVASPLLAPFDEGRAMKDAADGIAKGASKIGDSSDREDEQ